jgi:hypothetical protein
MKKTLLALAILAGLFNSAVADTTILSDSTFYNADWSSISLIPNPGEAPGVLNFNQVASGGNSGSYMQLNVSQTNPYSINGVYVINSGVFSSALIWNPSIQGAISSIAITFDAMGLYSSGGSYFAPMLIQNGSMYTDDYVDPFIHGLSGWVSHSGAAILPGDIVIDRGYDISTGNLNYQALDLSATGGLISFGFGVKEGSGGIITNSVGVDNFSVTITTGAVPEPSSYALFGLGALVLVIVATRRKQKA